MIAGITNKTKVFSYLKKLKAKVDFSKWVLTDFDEWKEKIAEQNKGLFCWNKDTSGVVLFLCSPENTWDYYSVLMHEVHHIVNYIATKKMMQDEIEAQAYLFEYLFNSIRRKLIK